MCLAIGKIQRFSGKHKHPDQASIPSTQPAVACGRTIGRGCFCYPVGRRRQSCTSRVCPFLSGKPSFPKCSLHLHLTGQTWGPPKCSRDGEKEHLTPASREGSVRRRVGIAVGLAPKQCPCSPVPSTCPCLSLPFPQKNDLLRNLSGLLSHCEMGM